MTKILITGIDGFIASHLAERVQQNYRGIEIVGTIRRLADKTNVKTLTKDVEFIDMELTDSHSVESVIKTVSPDKIFHLAAQSYVPTSWTSPANTIDTNSIGTLNVLEAARKYVPDAFVQIAGTSEEYGMVYSHECPIKEENTLRPLSPYGVSKVAADMLGYQYAKSYGMNILRTRTFNQTGPRRGEMFVDANFARQIVNIEQGKQTILMHGNLDAIRDFTDVRDTVDAYWVLSDIKWNGEVLNVCSGKGHSMKEVLSTLMSLADVPIPIKNDDSRMRPSDVPLLIGDNTKLKMYMDWKPSYTWVESLEDLLEYTRKKL
jgi:GDP-4-dehydro-6-deoxy-D-mannose reductase